MEHQKPECEKTPKKPKVEKKTTDDSSEAKTYKCPLPDWDEVVRGGNAKSKEYTKEQKRIMKEKQKRQKDVEYVYGSPTAAKRRDRVKCCFVRRDRVKRCFVDVRIPTTGGSKSKLPKEVQELVALIFDVDTMKSALVEFEIDVKKMPLGKLSKKQIESAYKVLSEALKLISEKQDTKDDSSSSPSSSSSSTSSQARIKAQLLDCSNRFFTLIPHDFGMKKPPILDDLELIKAKVAMLDNLSEIEVAYNLLKSEGDEDKDADPIDKHYGKLNTKIEVVDKKSDEFSMIKKYVSNTHASTHGHYKLVVEEAFKIERSGEKERFKPFKQLHNHKLLWHGSRLTDFAGILSQGLRIAPPEAPVTGYMFGKGVYFADMVSKSANYCCTSYLNPTGLILLADVALGNMYERTHAEYVEKLPKGMHSTKGLGRTCPDPSQSITIDGVEVPLGKGIDAPVGNTSLLYNEFIVYDMAQVNVKYLLKLKFDYQY